MKIIDPGHMYDLDLLDADVHGSLPMRELRFVKRIGDKFPGNVPPGYEGTTTQEVLRALIDRTMYVNDQREHQRNYTVIRYLREALRQLELRAAEERDENPDVQSRISTDPAPETLPTCYTCGHIECTRHA